MPKRIYPKNPEEHGEIIRAVADKTGKPPKPKHDRCMLPDPNGGDDGDVWYCFGCKKRYICKLVDDDNSGGSPQWKRRYWRWPRHKHKRLLDYSRCRCGKFMSQYTGIGPG